MQLVIRGALVGLAVFLGTPIAVSVTQAAADQPSRISRPQAAAPTNATHRYKVFLPMIRMDELSAPTLLASKKGVALTYGDCGTVTGVAGSWEYGWSPTPADCASIENVPMIEDLSAMNATIGGNSRWLMGFNEPDYLENAYISPAQAAQLWRRIENKFPNRKLLAPAPSGGNLNWLPDFRKAYISAYGAPPRLNGLALHCYAWQAQDCINYAQNFISWANSWGVPEVWVTEFSFSPTSPSSLNQSLQEAQTFINWMTNEDKITRYAWFAAKIKGDEAWLSPYFDTPLADYATNQLTAFGNSYFKYH